MRADIQATFVELQTAIDELRINGRISLEAEALWNALCECGDDESRLNESYDDCSVELRII